MDTLRIMLVENEDAWQKTGRERQRVDGSGVAFVAACSRDLLALCREGASGPLLLDVPGQAYGAADTTGHDHLFATLPDGETAQYYVIQPIDPEEARHFSQPLPEDTQLIELINRMMLRFGIPAHIQGSQYLCEGARIVCHRPEAINRITKELYPAIATRFVTTPSKVERSIRHAISVVWRRDRVDQINALFGFNVCSRDQKPTNGEFIALLATACKTKNT